MSDATILIASMTDDALVETYNTLSSGFGASDAPADAGDAGALILAELDRRAVAWSLDGLKIKKDA